MKGEKKRKNEMKTKNENEMTVNLMTVNIVHIFSIARRWAKNNGRSSTISNW